MKKKRIRIKNNEIVNIQTIKENRHRKCFLGKMDKLKKTLVKIKEGKGR